MDDYASISLVYSGSLNRYIYMEEKLFISDVCRYKHNTHIVTIIHLFHIVAFRCECDEYPTGKGRTLAYATINEVL